MKDWAVLFGAHDSPYEFQLELESGCEYRVPPPYPDAYVESSVLLYPRRIVVQRVDLTASAKERDKEEKIRVFRVVLEAETGEQIEIHRSAALAEELGAPVVDMTTCAACGGEIPEGQAELIDGAAYHKRCVLEEVADVDVRDLLAGDHSGGRHLHDRAGAVRDREPASPAEEDGEPPTDAQVTSVKTRSDDGITPSHMVTVVRFGERYITTLWARECDGLSGTVEGVWRRGLYDGELPRKSDVAYIDDKFFKGAGVVTAGDLRVWGRLYAEALREVAAE